MGRKTYIHVIIEKYRYEASSRATVRVRIQMKSEGQSVEKPMPSTVPEGVLSTTENLTNKVLVEEASLSVAEGEEVEIRELEERNVLTGKKNLKKGFHPQETKATLYKFLLLNQMILIR